MDAADNKPYLAFLWFRHLSCRFQGIVQKIAQNRTQIRTVKVGAAGKFYLNLELNATGVCRRDFAVDEVVRRFAMEARLFRR